MDGCICEFYNQFLSGGLIINSSSSKFSGAMCSITCSSSGWTSVKHIGQFGSIERDLDNSAYIPGKWHFGQSAISPRIIWYP